ncbi:MAG: SCO family protein [gamma proteobacterium symbiont of Lucinoma myriamae]|nr:SCO family protein [gamma proteobacterium symbiont of Lucinoma myriamae]
MKKILPLFILLLFIACVYVFFFWQPNTSSPLTVAAKSEGGEFTLQSLSGPVSLKDYRGKVTLLYFGYTMCPDVCPTNLSMMSNAFSQLDDKELSQIQGFFISVDPERDTMERLNEYTHYFHPSILGLSSTPEIIKELADRYGVAYQKVVQNDSATNYVVDHSSETYVVDPDGKLVERLRHAAPQAEILAAIKKYSKN